MTSHDLSDSFGRSDRKLVARPMQLEDVCTALLLCLGEDPDREGLKETPRRWAASWREFIEHDPGNISTSFTSHQVDEMVVVSGIETWSMCEHHLLPFHATAKIGYLTNGALLGLSKFARIVHKHAHRLQVQEQLTADIAEGIRTATGTEHVGVVIEGEHLCTIMRGVRTAQTMTTSTMLGNFRKPETRAEFLAL